MLQLAAPEAPALEWVVPRTAADAANQFERIMLDASALDCTPPRTAAAEAVKRFEDKILSRNTGGGPVFGSVQQLTTAYGLSPFVALQALRILEARGFGEMRRGAGGGLLLRTPSLCAMSRIMAIHLHVLGLDANDIGRAKARLLPYQRQCAAGASDFVTGLLDSMILQFDIMEDRKIIAKDTSNRAERIAWRIIAHAGERQAEDLGATEHLCQVFSCGKPIMTQAIRILEDMGVAVSVRGRRGGLRLQPASLNMIAWATAAYFRAWNFCPRHTSELIWAINKSHAVGAIKRSQNGLGHVKLASERLSQVEFLEGNWSEQVRLFRMVADLADDMVLHMLVKCLFAYEAGLIGFKPTITDRMTAGSAFASTRDVGAAILQGNPNAAVSAIGACEAISHKTRQYH